MLDIAGQVVYLVVTLIWALIDPSLSWALVGGRMASELAPNGDELFHHPGTASTICFGQGMCPFAAFHFWQMDFSRDGADLPGYADRPD